MARGLHFGGGAIFTAAVTTLEDDGADVLLTQRAVDSVRDRRSCALDSTRRRAVIRGTRVCSCWSGMSFYRT